MKRFAFLFVFLLQLTPMLFADSNVTAVVLDGSNRNRTAGDVTVMNGVEYEIEASGTVTLQDGFSVEKGATFAVYPSCF